MPLHHGNNRYFALIKYQICIPGRWSVHSLATDIYGVPCHPCYTKAFRFNLVGAALNVNFNQMEQDIPTWNKHGLAGDSFYTLMWHFMRALPPKCHINNLSYVAAKVVHEYCRTHTYLETMKIFDSIRFTFCNPDIGDEPCVPIPTSATNSPTSLTSAP